MRSLKILQLLGCAAFLLCASFQAIGAITTFCQPGQVPPMEKWTFEIKVVNEPLAWTGAVNGEELHKKVSLFYAGRDPRNARGKAKSPMTLGYYEPRFQYLVEQKRVYHKTVDGGSCATVVGIVFKIVTTPLIYLAKELPERSCTSRIAMDYQLEHHKVTQSALKEALEVGTQFRFKKDLYGVYASKGIAGRTPDEINANAEKLDSEAIGSFRTIFEPFVREGRKGLETVARIKQMLDGCNGEFGKVSALVANRGSN